MFIRNIKSWLSKHSSILIFVLAIALAGVAHGYNMFDYPYFENDEGTYLSQAYSVAYEGKLSNYTYWYDHAPFGWFLIAGWLLVTGGPFTFGYSLFSGRIFMLLIHVLSSGLIYGIVKKMTSNRLAPFIAVIAFSVSPMVVYFHRRLLLDNIMTFWMLVSLALLLYSRKRLAYVIAAGVTFGFSVLTKETAIVAAPAYFLIVSLVLDKQQRKMGWVSFFTPLIILLSYYIGFAFLKGELFPGEGHVSLIGTWQYQLTRGSGLPFWHKQSEFMFSFSDWLKRDSGYLIMAILSLFWVIVGKNKTRIMRAVGLIGASIWLFLMRGGLVIHFYFIPLIAFSAIAISLTLLDIARLPKVGFIIIIVLLIAWVSGFNTELWKVNESLPQVESIEWIKQNISPDAVIAVDQSQLIDLQLSRFPGDPAFPNAHWFFKLETDPEVKNNIINNDWRNIGYISLTHEFVKQVRAKKVNFISPTLSYATEIASWGPLSPNTYLNLDQRLSTNGDWVKVLKVYGRTDILLRESWQYYKEKFISPEGQVVDPQREITTSEGQAYALLRSLIVDDRESFDLILNWTQSRLQFRNEDKLFSWKWGAREDGTVGVIDSATATDADIDIATALILAGKKWEETRYLEMARPVVQDIWRQEVANNNDFYILTAGSWAAYGDEIVVNPSYITPAAFRLFKAIDPEHDWLKLYDDSYALLNRIADKSKVKLMSDWTAVSKSNQRLILPSDRKLSNDFGYDAMRLYWRVYQDYLWYGSSEAKAFLDKQTFLPDYYSQNGSIVTAYSISGTPLTAKEDNSFYGALLPLMKYTSQESYDRLLASLEEDYYDGAWEKVDNYYTQNWVWLGMALAEQKFILPTISGGDSL